MCFNICVFARDLYLKVLTERYCVMQIRKHVHSVFLCFAYTQCFDSALIMLLLVNKIIICD